jgi:hypothetical protein
MGLWDWAVLLGALAVVTFVVPAPRLPAGVRQRTTRAVAWIRGRSSSRRWVLLACGAAVLILLLEVVVVTIPSALVEHPRLVAPAEQHKAVSDARTGVVALIVALGAFGSLAYTIRTYGLSVSGQVTDRYSKAVEQLGDQRTFVRLGGVFALQRLINDSRIDQPMIVEVLASFVRTRAARAAADSASMSVSQTSGPASPAKAEKVRPEEDVQAALTVMLRRRSRPDESPIDLHGTDLSGARLEGADFSGADLRNCVLRDTRFNGCTLTEAKLNASDCFGASFVDAVLPGAFLIKTILDHAALVDADLQGAKLIDATLNEAVMQGAKFGGADLRGADLDSAQMFSNTLSDEQLAQARNADSVIFVES